MNPGSVVDGKYQIVRQLGQGGMGAVYEARHQGTGRRVALKVIIREALASGDREIIARFQREARASGAIDSQHVVQVLDTGVDPQSGSPYLVMEYLAGEDLHHLLDRLGPLSPDLALRIIAQACAGLARAHSEAVVHRDIKSANLFIARREDGDLVVKLLDFGIAKVRADPMSAKSANVTRTGAMLGSPLYMSPEQVVGKKEVDARSDLYSLGITLYEALTARTPYHDEETIGALVLAICSGRGLPLRQAAPSIAPNIAAIVERAMAIEPSARFASAEEMRAAIVALLPNGASLHERMLVQARASVPSFDKTAALVPSPSASADDVQTAANRFLPRAPGAATTPLGAVTPPPNQLPAAVTSNAFGGTNPPATRRGPPIVAIAAIVAVGVIGLGLGAYALKFRSAHAPAPPPSALAAPAATALPVASTPVVVSSSVAIAPEPAASASASAKVVVAPTMPPRTSAATAMPAAPAPHPAPATKPKADCTTPFTIDSAGIRHFKEECVQ